MVVADGGKAITFVLFPGKGRPRQPPANPAGKSAGTAHTITRLDIVGSDSFFTEDGVFDSGPAPVHPL